MPDPLPALNRSELDQIRGWRPSRLRTNGEDHTEYRAGYRAFRTGGTHGARETSCGPRGAHADAVLVKHDHPAGGGPDVHFVEIKTGAPEPRRAASGAFSERRLHTL